MWKRYSYTIIFCFFSLIVFSQNSKDSLRISKRDSIRAIPQKIDILAPSRAAFYSAIFPGLGQAYNKKYWKIPVVWAAVGTGTFFYIDNDNGFNRYRTAFKLRRSGRPDEFNGDDGGPIVSDDGLIRAQDVFKKNRDLSLFITIGLYILNIVEANVDAHLPDRALDTNISFNPTLFNEPLSNEPMIGATLTFNF